MNKIGVLHSRNGMSFGELNIDLNSPGLNLIMGENSDDSSGNKSRNGAGKSNLFTLVNYHLFERGLDLVNQRTKSSIINTEIQKNYLTTLNWSPAGSDHTYFSYQYQKLEDGWGTGAYLIKGGSYEDWENGVEGVEDVSEYKNTDTQAKFSTLLNMSWQEWNLLVNMTNVDDDSEDPFFSTTDKARRLELFQNLFGLNYNIALAEVKYRLSQVKAELSTSQTSIEAALNVLNDQLAHLPEESVDDMALNISAAVGEANTIVQAIQKLNDHISSTNIKRQLVADFDSIITYFQGKGYATLADIPDLEAEYASNSAELENQRQVVSQYTQCLPAWDTYDKAKERYDNDSATIEYYRSQGFDQNIEGRITEAQTSITRIHNANQLRANIRPYIAQIEDTFGADIPDEDWIDFIKECGSGIEAKAESIQKLTARESELAERLIPLNTNLDFLSRLKSRIAEHVKILEKYPVNYTAEEIENGLLAAKKDANEGFEQHSQATTELNLKKHELEHIGSGVCPTCKQELPEFDASQKEKLEAEVEELTAKVSQAMQKRNAATELQSLFQKEQNSLNAIAQSEAGLVQVYESKGSYPLEPATAFNKVEYLNDFEVRVDTSISQVKQEITDINQESQKVKHELDQESFYHATIIKLQEYNVPEKLALLELDCSQLDKLNAEVENFRKISNELKNFAIVEQDFKDAEIGVSQLVEGGFTREVLQQTITNSQAYINQTSTYLASVSDMLPNYKNLKSDKFDGIEGIRFMLEDTSEDESSVENLNAQLTAKNEEIAVLRNQRDSKIDLQERIKEQEAKMGDITHLKRRKRALEALEVMCGPNGLIYPRLERIFQHVNDIMNKYLTVMIPEGLAINKPVTSYFEMTAKGPIQTIYRGDSPIARLSKSEKARVKLARCLALREFCLPNKQCNLLMVDEIDGSSCDTNKERIWDCIQMHLSRMPQTSVWAVTHSKDMQESNVWAKRFMVTKQESMSTLKEIKE